MGHGAGTRALGPVPGRIAVAHHGGRAVARISYVKMGIDRVDPAPISITEPIRFIRQVAAGAAEAAEGECQVGTLDHATDDAEAELHGHGRALSLLKRVPWPFQAIIG